ncbi:septal ring lytic transglycosylase RlpA family protein [Thermodesulfobacteriota bacterium]
MKRRFFLYLIIILFLFACARGRSYVKVIKPPPSNTIVLPEETIKEIPGSYVVNGERYYPLSDSSGFVQIGKASWYGKKFQGRPTASGEIYDMYKKSAAHKTLPLGTYVKVLNLSNDKHIIVPINDRGPFVKGRIIDLSYNAAKEVDLIGPGVAEVKITALGKKVGELESGSGPKPLVELKDLKKGEFTIQVGAFQDRNNALMLADRLKVLFDYVNISKYVDENNSTLFRLHISKSNTLAQAGEIEKRLENMGFQEAFIIRI